MIRFALVGVLIALLALGPLAVLFALFDRFPIPGVGYASGIAAAVHVPQALLFYGLNGGFLIVAGLGAVVGALSALLARVLVGPGRASRSTAFAFTWVGSLVAVFAALLLLARWDHIAGPW